MKTKSVPNSVLLNSVPVIFDVKMDTNNMQTLTKAFENSFDSIM